MRLLFLSYFLISEIFVYFGKLKVKIDYIGRYISNIEMLGGKIVYVFMQFFVIGVIKIFFVVDWIIDFDQFEKVIIFKMKMIVFNIFCEQYLLGFLVDFFELIYWDLDNFVGKVFLREEFQKIGDFCVKYEIIILFDEVYDCLFYVFFMRIGILLLEIVCLILIVGFVGKNFYVIGW